MMHRFSQTHFLARRGTGPSSSVLIGSAWLAVFALVVQVGFVPLAMACPMSSNAGGETCPACVPVESEATPSCHDVEDSSKGCPAQGGPVGSCCDLSNPMTIPLVPDPVAVNVSHTESFEIELLAMGTSPVAPQIESESSPPIASGEYLSNAPPPSYLISFLRL